MITSKKHRRPVYAVLLAAGESRRCRPKKLLLPWGEKKLLEKSVANLTGSRAEETVVVLGHDPEPLQKILARLPCLVTRNRDYRRGMASSFLTGIIEIRKAFSPPADAGFLLALADVPFIDPKIVNILVDAYRTKKADIVVPVCSGRRGHPSIFHGRFSDEVAAGVREGGVRKILEKYPDRVHHVEIKSEAVLGDIDTRKDYQDLLKKFPPG